MSNSQDEETEKTEVRTILDLVVEDPLIAEVLEEALCKSHITKARTLAALSPALIAAVATKTEAPEVDGEGEATDASLWKGTVASLLAAARDEAAAQIEHDVEAAKLQLSTSLAASEYPTGTLSRQLTRPKQRSFTTAIKAVAVKLGRDSIPTTLVPSQRLMETLRLNLAAYIDFSKVFPPSLGQEGRGDNETRIAEDVNGFPVLIKAGSSSKTSDSDKSRSFSSHWVQCFLVFGIALLVAQEDVDLAESSSSTDDEEATTGKVKVQVVDLLAYLDKILWFADQYGFRTAGRVDVAVRMAMESTCRGGALSIGQCYQDWGQWSARASEVVTLSLTTNLGRAPSTPQKGHKNSQTHKKSTETPEQGNKRTQRSDDDQSGSSKSLRLNGQKSAGHPSSPKSRRSTAAKLRQKKRYSARRREKAQIHSPPRTFLRPDYVPYQATGKPWEAPDDEMIQGHVDLLLHNGIEKVREQSSKEVRDGTGVGAPLPSEFVCSSSRDQSLPILEVFEESMALFGLPELLKSIKGHPSLDKLKRLDTKFEEAAEHCRRSLCCLLGCSGRKSQCGSPLRPELLQAFIQSLRDLDTSLPHEIDSGVSLGIDEPLEPTGLFPAYSKDAQAVALEELRLRFRANYQSVENNPAVTEELIQDEVKLGRMRQITNVEAADPRRVFARMALLEKKSSIAGSSEPLSSRFRIVEDYRRNHLNARMRPSETVSLPRLQDLQRVTQDCLCAISEELRSGTKCSTTCGDHSMSLGHRKEDLQPHFMSFDISSAFRHIYVRESERFRLSTSVNHHYYEHAAVPFGTKVAPYHWCRLAACISRLQRELLHTYLAGIPHCFFIYVDDGLLLAPSFVYPYASSITLLLWRVLGVSLSWKKCQFNIDSLTYIGYELSLNDFTISISPKREIISKVSNSLMTLLSEHYCTGRSIARITGQLLFICNVCPYLKSFLQPFYSLLSIFDARGLRILHIAPTSKTAKVARFWLTILQNKRLILPILYVGKFVDVSIQYHVVVASDACLSGLGGFATFSGGSCYYFSQRVSPSNLKQWRDLLEEPSYIQSADMTLMELLAAASALDAARRLVDECGISKRLYIHLFTDNSAVVGCLHKLYSPSNKLAPVLQAIAEMLSCLSGLLDVNYIPGENNWLADGLSRSQSIRPPSAWKKWDIDLSFSV